VKASIPTGTRLAALALVVLGLAAPAQVSAAPQPSESRGLPCAPSCALEELVLVRGGLVAVATAPSRPDDWPGVRGPGAAADTAVARPDDRPRPRGPGAAEARSPRPDDRPGVRGPGVAPQLPAAVVDVRDGFDLRDAAIGAVFPLAVSLLLLGAVQVSRRRRLA
jgi:hypothetical protein